MDARSKELRSAVATGIPEDELDYFRAAWLNGPGVVLARWSAWSFFVAWYCRNGFVSHVSTTCMYCVRSFEEKSGVVLLNLLVCACMTVWPFGIG